MTIESEGQVLDPYEGLNRAARRAQGHRGPKRKDFTCHATGTVSRHRSKLAAAKACRRRNREHTKPHGRARTFAWDVATGLSKAARSPRRSRPPYFTVREPSKEFPGRPYAVIATTDVEEVKAQIQGVRKVERREAFVGFGLTVVMLVMLVDRSARGVQVAGLWQFLRQSFSALVGNAPTGYTVVGVDTTSKLWATWDDAGTKSYYHPGDRNTMVVITDPTYGADPTGVTDATTAINAAIVATGTGGIVWVPPGTYKVNTGGTTISVGASHCQILGASRADCFFQTAHATANIITLSSSAWYSSVQHITFTQSVTRTAGYSIVMTSGASRHFVFDCEFDNQWGGVQMQSHLSMIDLCEFRTFVAGGSWIEVSATASSAHDFQIDRLNTDNGSNLAGSSGINVTQCASLLMSNCSLAHGGNNGALFVNPGAGQIVPSIKAVNMFFDQGGYGMQVTGNATGIIQRIQFTNCWFSSNTNDGVRLNTSGTATTGVESMDFVNCDFYGNVNGINMLAGYKSVTVTASRFSGNTTTGILTTAVSWAQFALVGNYIGSEPSFGANALGINVQTGTYSSYVITDNWGLDSNTTKGITDAGTATLGKYVNNNQGAQMPSDGLTSIVAAVAPAAATDTKITSIKLPAGTLVVGTTFRIRAMGIITATAPTIVSKVRIGTGDVVGDAAAATSAAVAVATGAGWSVDAIFTVRSVGAGGTCIANIATLGTAISNTVQTATTALNTTVDNFIGLWMTSGGTTPVLTVTQAEIEVVKP